MGNCFRKQQRPAEILPKLNTIPQTIPIGNDGLLSQPMRPRMRAAPKLKSLNDNKLYRSRMTIRELTNISNHSFTQNNAADLAN
jgi:hypothetical protein